MTNINLKPGGNKTGLGGRKTGVRGGARGL